SVRSVDRARRTFTVKHKIVHVPQSAHVEVGDDQPAGFEAIRVGEPVRVHGIGNKAAAFVIVSVLFFATATLALTLVPRQPGHHGRIAPAGSPRATAGEAGKSGAGEAEKSEPHGSVDEQSHPIRLADLTIALRTAPSLVLTALVVFVAVGA